MKLKLPTLLLGLLLAGISARATETIDLNNHQWTYECYMRICTDANLTMNRYCYLGEEKVTIPGEPSQEGYVYGLYWQSKNNNGSYTLTGSGTLDCGGECFTMEGGYIYPVDGDLSPYEEEYPWTATYTIGSDIQLKGTTLEAQNGAQVVFKGSVYSGRPSDPEEAWQCEFFADDDSSMDLTEAQIRDGDYVSLTINATGTIICPNYTVSTRHGLEIMASPFCEQPSLPPDMVGILQGNLTLSGGRVYVCTNSAYAIENYTFTGYPHFVVTGTVNVTGETAISFFNEGFWDSASQALNDSYISPEVSDIVLYCQNYTGDADLLLVEEGRLDSNTDKEQFRLNQELKLAFIPQTDGRFALTVVEAGNTPVVPEKPETIITSGSAPETLDGNTVIELAPDGSVDATSVTQGLGNAYVSGQGGTLTTAPDQTFDFTKAGAIGFDIIGADENTPGANLQVGVPGGASAAVYQLSGSTYRTASTKVDSGLLIIDKDAALATGDFTITKSAVTNHGAVKAEEIVLNTGAAMANRGILTGNVTATDGSALTNEGTISGLTTVQQGALIQGGGRYDRTLVEQGGILAASATTPQQHTSLTLSEGSTVRFSLEGTPGNALIQTNALTLNGTATADVTVGLGLLAQGGTSITLNLIQADTSEGDGDWNPLIPDEHHLLKEGSATVNWENGILTFTAEVNPAAVAALASQDGANMANALWASTNTVQNFARHALAQLPQAGSSHVWVSGLGSFIDLGTDGQTSGFRYNGGGYAVGTDYACTETFSAGVALGQEFGRFKSDDHQTRIRQESLMAGLYARYREELGERETAGISAYVAFGTVENKADTNVGGDAALPGHGSWDDTVWTFGLKGEWEHPLSDSVTLIPYVGLEYVHGAQEDVNERFAGGSRAWREGAMQVWRLPVGAALRGAMPLGDGQTLLPELSLGYVGDIARQSPHVESSLYGISQRHKGSEPGRSAFQLRVGANWIMSREWSVGAFYTLEARSGQTSQAASATVRYSF